MVTPITPNPNNPNRAGATGFDNFVVQFTNGATLRYLREDGTWAVPPGGGGGTVWGGITGNLADQTDLNTVLGQKANASAISVVGFTGVYSDLTSKPTLGTVAALSYPGGTSAFLRADGTWAIPQDVTAAWGNITGTLASQTDLNTALGLKANLAGPTFTGVPAAPTAVQDTATTQLATTAFVLNQAFNGSPNMDGTVSSGSSGRYARGDHVHPSDTSRAPLVSPVFTGVPQAPTAAPGTNTVQIATTAFVTAAVAGGGGGFANPMTTAQDIIVGGTGGTPGRLGVGANGTFLGVVGGVLTYTTPSGSGDVVGPASAVSGNVVTFNGTTGKLIQDSGVALSSKANLASPTFTGTPLSTTAAVDTNTTQIATTAFVVGQAGSANPLINGTVAVGTSLRYARQDHVHPVDTSRAPLSSPSFVGVPDAPTAAVDTNTTQLATTAFVVGQAASANPVMNGTVAVGTSLRYARADHVHASDTSRAPLASPTFTGTPAAPSATFGTDTTQLATTAFVQSAIRSMPQRSASAATTTVAADAGGVIIHPSADTTARTFTIDSNANVPYPVGTAITIANLNAAGVVTIAITSDTMRLAGAGTTGSRTLAANGVATALKVGTTEWIINGTGLT